MSNGYVNLPDTNVLGLTAAELPNNIPATYIADGTVSTVQFQYVSGVTSAIQTQLDAKQVTVTSSVDISAKTLTSAGAVVASNLGTATVGTTLVVDISGNIRPLTSTRETKENIRPLSMDPRVLLTLPTYSFNYVGSDPLEDITHGFIAEEVAEVAPDLVIFKDSKPYSLQHIEFLAPMLELMKAQEARIIQLELVQESVLAKLFTMTETAEKRQLLAPIKLSLIQRILAIFRRAQ